MTKKRVVLGVVLAVTISVSLYFAIRPVSQDRSTIINEKMVMELGRKAGFEMDNPARFGEQVEKKYDELTKEQCHQVFCVVLGAKRMPQVIKALPPDLRKEAIDRTAEWLRKYREGMTEEEKEKLRRKIKSSERGKMVQEAKYFYFEGYSAEERAEIAPITSEILKILSCL